ncbi:MAG TPA: NUDIX hydrolase [Sphingomonas sp.]
MTATDDRDLSEEIRWQGKFITAKQRGRWEYVGRARGIRAAAIVAVDDGHVLLVEQYRVPLGRACLELPAGLVGDHDEGEAIEAAAARELEEETGYSASHIEMIGEFASSPGMVSETFSLVRATGLTKTGEGGGVEGEGITVHRVPLAGIAGYVETIRARGMAIDAKLLLLLGAGILAGGEGESR